MKSYPDRLRETPIDHLRLLISRQEGEIRLKQRDLNLMIGILSERLAEKKTETDNESENR